MVAADSNCVAGTGGRRAMAAFLVAAKIVEDRILLHDTATNQPLALTRAEFEQRWQGGVILITKTQPAARHDRQVRHHLVHARHPQYRKHARRGAARLVLPAAVRAGLAAVLPGRHRQGAGAPRPDHARRARRSAWSRCRCSRSLLGGLRTYLFSHTTNRIDVELGARLFRHLMALPIAYFQARRVGDSVARVRELENIRNFLTSSALTLVIDLFFTFVFLAVMFFYCPLLTLIVLAAFPFYIALSVGRRRRCSAAGSTKNSTAAPRTRRSWSRASPASRRSRRWRSSRRCSGAGKSSSPATSRASFRVVSLSNSASQVVSSSTSW